MPDVLREGLADYVQDECPMAERVKVGSTEQPPKKKRRKTLASWKRRVAIIGSHIQVTTEVTSQSSQDEPVSVEAVPLMAGSSFGGRDDDMGILSPEHEGMVMVLEEVVLVMGEPVVLEGEDDEDEVPFVVQRTRRLAREVLA